MALCQQQLSYMSFISLSGCLQAKPQLMQQLLMCNPRWQSSRSRSRSRSRLQKVLLCLHMVLEEAEASISRCQRGWLQVQAICPAVENCFVRSKVSWTVYTWQ